MTSRIQDRHVFYHIDLLKREEIYHITSNEAHCEHFWREVVIILKMSVNGRGWAKGTIHNCCRYSHETKTEILRGVPSTKISILKIRSRSWPWPYFWKTIKMTFILAVYHTHGTCCRKVVLLKCQRSRSWPSQGHGHCQGHDRDHIF